MHPHSPPPLSPFFPPFLCLFSHLSHASPPEKEGSTSTAPADDAAAAAGIHGGEDPGDALARIISENWDSLFEEGEEGGTWAREGRKAMDG